MKLIEEEDDKWMITVDKSNSRRHRSITSVCIHKIQVEKLVKSTKELFCCSRGFFYLVCLIKHDDVIWFINMNEPHEVKLLLKYTHIIIYDGGVLYRLFAAVHNI